MEDTSNTLLLLLAAAMIGAVLLHERLAPTGSLNPANQAVPQQAAPPCNT